MSDRGALVEQVVSPRSAEVGGDIQGPAGRNNYAWFVLIALTLGYFLSNLDRYLISVALSSMKTDLNLTDTQLGVLTGPAFVIFYCFFSLPLGRLADRVHRFRLIAIGVILWSAATAALAFSTSFWGIFAARSVAGVGDATLLPAATSLIADLFTRGRVGRATGILLSGSAWGKSAAFIGGGAVLSLLTLAGGLQLGRHFEPWQGLFVLVAIPGVVLGLLFLTMREPQRIHAVTDRPPWREVGAHIAGNRLAYALHIGCAACAAVAAATFVAWSPSFYVREFDLSPSTAAMGAGLATVVFGPLGFFIGGVALDAIRRRGHEAAPVYMLGVALFLGIPSTLLFTLSDNLIVSVLGYGLTQMIIPMAATPAMVGMQWLTPARHRGLAVAAYVAILTLVGAGLGPIFTGLANDWIFRGQQLGLSISTVIVSFALLGLVLAAVARQPFARSARQQTNA